MASANNIDVKLFESSVDGDLEGVVDALTQGGRVSVRNPQGFTPLSAAAKYGHTSICGLLLAHGSDVNDVRPQTRDTALHEAALRGHEAVVEALLSWGAMVDPQDHAGWTPLFSACQEGHLACVVTLLKARAAVSVPNIVGQLPIHVASVGNRVEIVRTLMDYGCTPDMVNCHA